MSQVRIATKNDIAEMVVLSEQKRTEYAHYQPLFWRKAEDSAEKQEAYFYHLLEQDHIILLVSEADTGIDGFIIASIMPAPPVYDIGGLNCMIDDFCVTDEETWFTIGRELLGQARQTAKELGAVQLVVVTGHHHEAKRAFLSEMGLSLASEWYTAGIDTSKKE